MRSRSGIAAFIIVLLATGVLVYKSIAPSLGVDPTGYQNCPNDENIYTCLEAYFLTYLKATDSKSTLIKLNEAMVGSVQITGLCHPIVHRVGREAYQLIGSAPKAFAAGGETCASGYYHGVLEGYLSKAPELEKAVVEVCQNPGGEKSSGFIYFQCVHGLGHGLMFKTADNLQRSLELCDLLGTAYDRESCYGGVFMQNIVNDSPYNIGHAKPVAKAEDPLYPCNDDTVIAEKYKSGCYFLVTSQIMKVAYPDWGAVAGWCDKVEEKYRYLCYQSMGRDVSGATLRDPQKSYEVCQKSDPKYLGDCVTGVAKDFLEYDPKNPQAKTFCGMVSEGVRPTCFSALGQMIQAIYTSYEDRKRACQDLTNQYQSSCLGQISAN